MPPVHVEKSESKFPFLYQDDKAQLRQNFAALGLKIVWVKHHHLPQMYEDSPTYQSRNRPIDKYHQQHNHTVQPMSLGLPDSDPVRIMLCFY